MKLIFDYAGTNRRFPYRLYQQGEETYYKLLLRGRFLYVSRGKGLIDRAGELDIPHIGASRQPIGDFVYDSATEARAAFERFHASPDSLLSHVLSGRKP